VIVPEYQGHPGNSTLIAMISYFEGGRGYIYIYIYHRGPYEMSKEGSGTTAILYVAKHSCTHKVVCWHNVIMNQSALVLTLFRHFWQFTPQDIA
jgi:hypothetical protein